MRVRWRGPVLAGTWARHGVGAAAASESTSGRDCRRLVGDRRAARPVPDRHARPSVVASGPEPLPPERQEGEGGRRMPSLTRRALVTLAALGPAAALAAPGSAATGSGPPPPPPELEALLERATYRGDLDVMLRKGAVRVLTAYSKTDFFVDKGESGGVTYEYMRAFEAFLQKRQGGKGATGGRPLRPGQPRPPDPGPAGGRGRPRRRQPDGHARAPGRGRLLRALPRGRQGGRGHRPGLARARRRRRPRRPGGVGAALEQLLGEPPGPRPAPRGGGARPCGWSRPTSTSRTRTCSTC